MLNLSSAEEYMSWPVAGLGAAPSRVPVGPTPTPPAVQAMQYRPGPRPDGSLVVDPEIHLPSPGMDVDISYYYNSGTQGDTGYGAGRTINQNLTLRAMKLPDDTPYVEMARGDGSLASYLYVGSVYQPQTPELVNSLTRDDGNGVWLETVPDGRVFTYPIVDDGQVSQIASVFNQNVTHLYHYSGNKLVALEDAVHRLVTFSYGSTNGLLEYIQDWAGRLTSFSYDTTTAPGMNLLQYVQGPTGCVTEYGYDEGGRLTSVTDPNGYMTTYAYDTPATQTYDTSGKVIGKTLVGVGEWKYDYPSGAASVTTPENVVSTQTLSSGTQPGMMTNPAGTTGSFSYNSRGLETSRQDVNGSVWTTLYDPTGVTPVGSIDPLGAQTTYGLDDYHNATTITYADGSVWQYQYGGTAFDPTGQRRLLQVQIDPLGCRTSYLYNSFGQVTQITDPLGRAATFIYDSLGNRHAVQDPLGKFTTFTYDLAGNVVTMTDALGRSTQYSYDGQNRLLSRTNPLGETYSYLYDSAGNLTHVTDPLGHTTVTEYNAFGMATTVTDALGHTRYFRYDSDGNLVAVRDELGNWATTIYDAAGRVWATQDALGYLTTLTYDLAGRVTTVTDALGRQTGTAYDLVGRPIAQIDAATYRVTTTYDLMGRVVSVTDQLGYINHTVYDIRGAVSFTRDPLNNVTSYSYDPAGRQIATQDAAGFFSTTVYDANSRVVSMIDELGRKTQRVYDDAGQMRNLIDATGAVTTYTYDLAGRRYQIRDARGNRTTQLYDAAGRVTTLIDGMSNYTTYQYDAGNRLTTVIDALGRSWVTIYDAAGRPVQSITPLGNSTYTAYDARGQVTTVTDPLGHASKTGYDPVGRVASMTDARGYVTTFLYDGRDLLTGVQTANGGITTNTYNHRGDLLTVTNPLDVVTADYTPDANGNVLVAVDGRGIRLSCTYDALDRLQTVQYPDDTRATYMYDGAGQLTTLIEKLGTSTYTFDPVGRMGTVTRPDIGTISYLYDSVGNRRRMKDPDGGIATYTWDNANRMTALLNRYNENTTKDYNAVGLENNGNFGNGMRWRRTFYPDLNVQYRTLQHSTSQGSTQILRYSATYDAAGRRTVQIDPNGFVTYTYDAANQLIREQHPVGTGYDIQYSYDGMGNRTTMAFNGALTTYSHDAWNRLLGRQNPDGTITSYAYDGAGNRITETTGSSITTYTWDYENRMSGVQHPGTGGIETFTYLLDGERAVESGVGKGLRHSLENSSGKRYMVWDDQNLLQERDASGSLVAHYTGRPNDYWSLISQRRGSTTLYAISDMQGSVREWYASDETRSGSSDFSAFGKLLSGSGSVVTPYGFEGEYGYYLDVTGRLYVRARELDTEDGVWCSVDPMGFAGGDINLFGYLLNHATGQVDPSGQDFWISETSPNFGYATSDLGEVLGGPSMAKGRIMLDTGPLSGRIVGALNIVFSTVVGRTMLATMKKKGICVWIFSNHKAFDYKDPVFPTTEMTVTGPGAYPLARKSCKRLAAIQLRPDKTINVDCNGIVPGQIAPMPLDVVLAHELGHAVYMKLDTPRNDNNNNPGPNVTGVENPYRAERRRQIRMNPRREIAIIGSGDYSPRMRYSPTDNIIGMARFFVTPNPLPPPPPRIPGETGAGTDVGVRPL